MLLKMLGERAVGVKRDLHIWFLDYTNAFDKVRHEEMLEMLQNLDIKGKDIQLILNLYWVKTAAVIINNEAGKIKNYYTRCASRLCVFTRPF